MVGAHHTIVHRGVCLLKEKGVIAAKLNAEIQYTCIVPSATMIVAGVE
jgi:hypothetical protein